MGASVNVMGIQTQYCDGVSMNCYCHQVSDMKLPGGLDAPVVISEIIGPVACYSGVESAGGSVELHTDH